MSGADPLSDELETLRAAYARLEDRFRKVLEISDKYEALARSVRMVAVGRSRSEGGAGKRPDSEIPDALAQRLRARLSEAGDLDDPFLKDVAALLARYDKMNSRVSKILSISDSYQAQLREALSKVETLARTDSLTGLLNRRAMMDHLELEAARSFRYGIGFSVVLFDVDDFKKVNDTYGHDTGDGVLRSIAAAIVDSLRKSDVCARWGGEEFLVLFPETGKSEAFAAAEKCRVAIEGKRYVAEGREFETTVSGGIASFGAGTGLAQVLKDADAAMYRAKALGKNRIESSR